VRPHHRTFALLLAALAALAMAGCGDDDEADDTPLTGGPAVEAPTLHAEFDSGSIAPPYNHAAVFEIRAEDSSMHAQYTLMYRYRDGAGELPPDADADLAWDGMLTGDAETRARGLLDRPGLGGKADDGVGGPSWKVLVMRPDGITDGGIPADEGAWRALLCAIDAQARQATGRTGTAQSC
jgi:hypothetical protein